MSISKIIKIGYKRLFLIILGFSLTQSPTFAGEKEPVARHTENVVRPKIGVVLSGGGARGMAHVGVLKYLEELNIPVDYIAGTSMGGIVAALYASGMSADDIEHVMMTEDWLAVFNDQTQRQDRSFRRKQDDLKFPVNGVTGFNNFRFQLPPGLIDGQQIRLLLSRYTLPVSHIRDFDAFPIPFRVVATDITTGERVVLKNGDVVEAIKASMSIPGVFAPVEIDGRLLVDGGMSDNLPVELTRSMGADILIVVDISTPLKSKDELKSVIAISGQTTGLMVQKNTLASREKIRESDVLIQPHLEQLSSADFFKAEKIIDAGYASVQNYSDELIELSISAERFRGYRKGFNPYLRSIGIIDYIRIENQSGLHDEVIRTILDVEAGEEFDEEHLRQRIDRLFGLGFFEKVDYQIEHGEQTGLVIRVVEKSWGPGYLQYGLYIRGSSFQNDNALNLKVGYTQTMVNSLAAEWRVVLQIGDEPQAGFEFYQPLDFGLRYFILPEVAYLTRNYFLYNDGDRLAKYQSRKVQAKLSFGRELGDFGRIAVSGAHFAGETREIIGSLPGGPETFNENVIGANFTVDKLDSINFPRKGIFTRLSYDDYISTDDIEYTQSEIFYLQAFKFERHSIIGRVRYQTTLDDLTPLHSQFRAGGFLNISGLAEGELVGNHYGHLMGMYMHKTTVSELFPVYVGASLELGNMWQSSKDISGDDLIPAGSAFVGIDTFLGPAFIALGIAEGGNQALYIYFGRTFFE